MALPKRTTVRRPKCTLAAGAVVFAALAVASSGPAWGQDTGDEALPREHVPCLSSGRR